MKTGQILFFLFIMIFLNHGFSDAKMYKYVDENGVTTFQDYPPENKNTHKKFEVLPTVKSQPSTVKTEAPSAQNQAPSDQKAPKSNHYRRAKVELFVTSWCKYCKKAENFFRSKGIPYKAYNIEKDKAAAKRKNRLSSGKGVPFAIVNGKNIYGFSPNAYEKALQNP